jgi:hypothetical protein
MYDGLTMWDLLGGQGERDDPGLATEWKVDDADKKKWTFKLRPASLRARHQRRAVWNVEGLKQDALQFDASQVSVTASRMPTLASAPGSTT